MRTTRGRIRWPRWRGGAPLVVSRRVAFPMERGLLADVKYGSARLYLAVSKYAAERLHERGMPWSRIRVVYDGVPIPARATSATGGVVALAKNGPRAVLAAAASAGVPVHFVSDLWQDLSTASVFVYLSDMEGLGSAALAAMAAGVPVIASRVGGLPEIVEHERTGILMADDRELPQALRRLLDDPRAAAEMGRRGRERGEREIFPRQDGGSDCRSLQRGSSMTEIALAFLAGLLIGSFLNVCIFRLPRDLSVVRPRSFCPGCEKPIAWHDNIPLVSYALLGGRCRHCRERIPIRYPAVELATAIAFALSAAAYGASLLALKYCIFSALLIMLTACDFETQILPDEFTLGGTAIGLVLAAFVRLPPDWSVVMLPRGWSPRWTSVAEAAIGAGVLSGLLWLRQAGDGQGRAQATRGPAGRRRTPAVATR